MKAAKETKQGYKKTKIGWIPEDWENKRYDEIAEIKVGRDLNESFFSPVETEMHKYPVYSNTVENYGLYGYYDTPEYNEETATIVGRGAGLGTSFYRSKKYGAIGRLLILKPKITIDAKFISEYTNHKVNFYIESGGIPQLTGLQLATYQVAVPPLPEQQKIADILSTWDKAIEKNQILIEQLKSRKKGLFDKLLLGKIRVKQKSNAFKKTKLGVEIPSDWDIKTVDSIFQERKEVSKDINQYPLYSLTIEKGLTEKTAQYERSFLLKDKENNKYRLVYNDDILYNPMNLRFGAIAKASITDPVSISAYYNVIKPIDLDVNTDYFINLFKTHRYMHIYERIAIGSLEEKKRVHLSMFLKLELPFPPFDEQVEITKVLNTADAEIKTQETYLAQLQAQKKGLMQQLLTGQKRVKVD